MEALTAHEYVEAAFEKPWSWGKDVDCILSPAGWVAAKTGVDPASRIRGKYNDLRSAHRIIKAAGGLASLIAREMAFHGFEETEEPETGDVAVVTVISGYRGAKPIKVDVGAIRLGPFWAIRSIEELIMLDVPHVKAWRI